MKISWLLNPMDSIFDNTHQDERQDFFSDMDKQYKNIERQNEIRELYEQETLRSQQTISNNDSMGHESEM